MIPVATRKAIFRCFEARRRKWHGDMKPSLFLKELYPNLDRLKGVRDPDERSATIEIQRHTEIRKDWPDDWVIDYPHFRLLKGQDKLFLDFLCYALHPSVVGMNPATPFLLEDFNNNLAEYGYKLQVSARVGGQPTYAAIHRSPPTAADKRGRKALIIACSDYPKRRRLKDPTPGISAIKETLVFLRFDVTMEVELTNSNFKKCITAFLGTIRKSDIVVFYYAGHGIQVGGVNYLLPIDAKLAKKKDVQSQLIDVSALLDSLATKNTSANIIILDACRDNPYKLKFDKGLTEMKAPRNSLIGYSTSVGETAPDNSVYTQALADQLPAKGVSINDIFQRVAAHVETVYSNQVPWFSTSFTTGFFLNK